MMNTKRKDPIFDIETPLLFAHRGGAKEAPESTIAAFRHAIASKADVLELDVQLTKDRKIVVWHGPELDNVKIKGQSSSKLIRLIKGKRNIWHYSFDEELKDSAWVADPKKKAEDKLKNIPENVDRKLILLEEFLDFLNEIDSEKKIPLNIELKGDKIRFIKNLFLETDEEGEHYLLKQFKDIMDLKGNGRKIIVASTSEKVLRSFDNINSGPYLYPTNLSLFEQRRYSKFMGTWYVSLLSQLSNKISKRKKPDLKNMAFETSYRFLTKELVEKVREEQGAIYVFLTGFLFIKALVKRHKTEPALVEATHAILNTGVDGIMTDYPEKMGQIMREWSSKPEA